MSKRIYINPTDPLAEAYRNALITHPSKFEIVENVLLSDASITEIMPAGTLATWTTSYFVADAEIDAADLTGKTVEISVEQHRTVSNEHRLDEAMSVLSALGISKMDDLAITRTSGSLAVAGFHAGSRVSLVHRSSTVDHLYISITDVKLRIELNAPLGATALASQISGHSADGTHTVRPLYRSVISRWLGNY
jgi:hypothetical protein